MTIDAARDAGESHARRPHPIDRLISPRLRARLVELDPLMNLDRLVQLITEQRSRRSSP